MQFDRTVNDDAIRIAQLGEAISSISRVFRGTEKPDVGPVLESLLQETEFLKFSIKQRTEQFRRAGDKWVW